jgi:tetratricopeptide (TPR) repeat protein
VVKKSNTHPRLVDQSRKTKVNNHLLPFSKGALAVVGAILLLLVLIGSRKSAPADASLKNPLTERAACRFALASLNGAAPIDNEIARQQSLIRNGSTAALERLGWTFVNKARLTFDASYYNLAEQCAACMEATGANGPDALLLRAHALQSLHRFKEAEAVARKLVSTRERPFDYGVLGDVLIDEGKVREGAAAYQKMIDLRPDLQSYARAAHIRWLTGDLSGAIELMKLAVAGSSPNDAEAAAWVYTRLSLYQLQYGATKQALDSCSAALALKSDYAPAMFARGRVLLALHRPFDAVVELQRAAELNPLPEYQWALADALALTGDRDRANQVESQIIDRGATEDPRSFALYLATHGENVDHAVQLAQQELTNRQDVFTHDALAWALAVAGRTAEAQEHAKQALSEGTVDARLFLHAGIIAARNHDVTQARRWLQKAASIQQMLLPSERTLLASTVGAALSGRPFHEKVCMSNHGRPRRAAPTVVTTRAQFNYNKE